MCFPLSYANLDFCRQNLQILLIALLAPRAHSAKLLDQCSVSNVHRELTAVQRLPCRRCRVFPVRPAHSATLQALVANLFAAVAPPGRARFRRAQANASHALKVLSPNHLDDRFVSFVLLVLTALSCVPFPEIFVLHAPQAHFR